MDHGVEDCAQREISFDSVLIAGIAQGALTLGVVVGELVLGVPPGVAGAVGVPHSDPLLPLLPDHLRAGRLPGLGLLRKTCMPTSDSVTQGNLEFMTHDRRFGPA